MQTGDDIVALSTGAGGAIAVIRMSGNRAHEICDKVFRSKSGKRVTEAAGYTMLYGRIADREETVDDVVIGIYRAPHSYTGENMVEISCHASRYITSKIIRLLIDNGARAATAGEFTSRAFLAGKMDLVQAEAVADIIASQNRASHFISEKQMKGGYSAELAELRDKLLHLVSLLELELDFSEEDVEFADRNELMSVMNEIHKKIESLTGSFTLGNAVKNGIGVAIVGSPNVGKSTLLNALLKEDRAMVSEIAGTTRDVIEESVTIDGVEFRFIDTAGIRNSKDRLEQMGIERTYAAIEQARIILLLVDASSGDINKEIAEGLSRIGDTGDRRKCIVINKCDNGEKPDREESDDNKKCHNTARCNKKAAGDIIFTKNNTSDSDKPHKTDNDIDGIQSICISAKYGYHLERLTEFLSSCIDREAIYGQDTIVTNARHYEALQLALKSLDAARDGLNSGLPTDLVALNAREIIYHLGTITGQITTDDILSQIFSKFCIGK